MSGAAATLPGLPDRSTAIKVFGIVQIALGALAAMMVPMALIGSVVGNLAAGAAPGQAAAAPLPLRFQIATALSAGGFYALVAAVLIWSGVGAVRLRRWAGDFTLVCSILWLAGGVAGIVYMSFMLPVMMSEFARGMANPPNGRPLPPEMARVMGICFGAAMMAFVVVAYVVIPGALAWFHSRPSVRSTLRQRDPGPVWTDRCPLPVLGLAILFVTFAAGFLGVAVMGLAPLFGVLLTGAAGTIVLLASAAAAAVIAGGLFRVRPWAWWAALLWTLLWASSAVVTFSKLTLVDMYVSLGVTGQKLELAKRMAEGMDFLPWALAVFYAAALAYQFYVLRYFRPAGQATR